jgi:hypothetical protein
MLPFPDEEPDPFVPDSALQRAFDDAMSRSPNPPTNVPIAVVAVDAAGPPHGFAGQLVADMHFSASLLKVAFLYAAHALRKAANDLLTGLGPATTAEALQALRDNFDDPIKNNLVPQAAHADPATVLPRYDKVFSYDPATFTVNFSAAFQAALFDAIADGSNTAGGTCVHGVGLGYLTTAPATAGFFDSGASSGIWLGGDFGNGFAPQRIPSLNDGQVAQATTVREMAKLFTLLVNTPPLVGPQSSAAMLHLLEEAARRGHLFLNRQIAGVQVNFVTINSKIGLAALKDGRRVASEAAVLRELSTGNTFVVVFQNQIFVNDTSITPIAQVVDDAIASFLFP